MACFALLVGNRAFSRMPPGLAPTYEHFQEPAGVRAAFGCCGSLAGRDCLSGVHRHFTKINRPDHRIVYCGGHVGRRTGRWINTEENLELPFGSRFRSRRCVNRSGGNFFSDKKNISRAARAAGSSGQNDRLSSSARMTAASSRRAAAVLRGLRSSPTSSFKASKKHVLLRTRSQSFATASRRRQRTHEPIKLRTLDKRALAELHRPNFLFGD